MTVRVKQLQLATVDEAGRAVERGFEIPPPELKVLLKTGNLEVIPRLPLDPDLAPYTHAVRTGESLDPWYADHDAIAELTIPLLSPSPR